MSEAPATPQAPAGEAPAEASTTPAATPAAAPPAPPDPASGQASTGSDLGEGPDGDPVEGESEVDKYKRIARREQKEARLAIETSTQERDAAVQRAEAAEQALAAAQTAAEESSKKLPELESQLAEANTALTEANAEILRYKIGAEKGLTMKQSQFLKGSTKEEVEAAADDFIEANSMPGNPGGRTPVKSPDELVAVMNRNR